MVQPIHTNKQQVQRQLGELSGGSLFQAVAALALKDANSEGKLRKAVGQTVLKNTQVRELWCNMSLAVALAEEGYTHCAAWHSEARCKFASA